MKIAIYTANFNNKDCLRSPMNYRDNPNIDYFEFVDTVESEKVYPYTQVLEDITLDDVTKNARKLKILGHPLLKNYDILLWHDSNIQLDTSYISHLMEVSLSNKTFITTFSHPNRNDFYSEAMTCIRVKKDNHFKILRQAIHYFFSGLPAHNGLQSTGILIKNNNYFDQNFLDIWWHNTLRFSRRDQLSLAYTVYKSTMLIGYIEGNIFDNNYTKYHNHAHSNYLVKNKTKNKNRFFMFSFYCIKLMRKIRKNI